MSRWIRRVLSVALAVCLMLCHSAHAFAWESEKQVSARYSESDVEESEHFEQSKPELKPENPGEPETATTTDLPDPQEIGASDIVYGEAELAAWIEQHKETGGTVSLGASVTITEYMGIYGIHGEITIDTGKYGFVFDGSTLPNSDILITGEGVDMPVVDVLRTNGENFWEMSWNNSLMMLNITATGRDGQGGIAMRIIAEDSKAFSMGDIYEQGVIRSYGDGAIALWLDVPMEVYCYRAEVFGDNSVAAYAPNGAGLYYCKLTAEGEGASAAAGSDVVLDTCAATPEPDGVRNLPRSLLPESLRGLYLPIRQNDSLTRFDVYPFTSIVLPMSGGDGYETARRLFPIEWDYDAYDNIDTGVLGKSDISGYLPLPLQGLGLESTAISLTVEVRDPDLPCIESISAKNNEPEKHFLLKCWDSYDPADGNIVLWCSDDEGETWRDATWSDNVVWDGYDLRFFYDTLEQPVWLVLELVGIGDSNTVVLSEKDGWAVGGSGGDRTGTDREGAGPSGIGTPGNGGAPSGGDGQSNSGNGGAPGESEESGGDGSTPAGGGGPSGGAGQSNSGNGSAPGESKEPGDDGGISPSGGKPISGVAGKDDDDRNGRYPQGNTDEIVLTPAPEETPPLDKDAQSLPALAAVPDSAASAEEYPKVGAIAPKAENTEKTQPSQAEVTLQTVEEPLAPDPEQSASEPGFSANTLAVFFLGVAALCIGALLVLRSDWFGRWRHGKG